MAVTVVQVTRPSLISNKIVAGPEFTNSTFIDAPNTPGLDVTPDLRSPSTKRWTIVSACCRAAAPTNEGRRPLRRSPRR